MCCNYQAARCLGLDKDEVVTKVPGSDQDQTATEGGGQTEARQGPGADEDQGLPDDRALLLHETARTEGLCRRGARAPVMDDLLQA